MLNTWFALANFLAKFWLPIPLFRAPNGYLWPFLLSYQSPFFTALFITHKTPLTAHVGLFASHWDHYRLPFSRTYQTNSEYYFLFMPAPFICFACQLHMIASYMQLLSFTQPISPPTMLPLLHNCHTLLLVSTKVCFIFLAFVLSRPSQLCIQFRLPCGTWLPFPLFRHSI